MFRIFITFMICFFVGTVFCQDGVNVSDLQPSGGSKGGGENVNLFSGQPDISIPLFNYSNSNGIGVNLTLHYVTTGGIHLEEQTGESGLGWYMSYGGSITRTVRGLPDDVPLNGFLYTPAIPADFRNDADKYYYDTLDSQQDEFHFNFNGRSGKFYIRKNKDIILVPFSKLNVQPVYDGSGKIQSFTITTEDGVKYIFIGGELSTTTSAGMHAGTSNIYKSWNLSQQISPFNADTIKYNYTTEYYNSSWGFPIVFLSQSPYINIANAFYYIGSEYISNTGTISSISLPNKQTINFYYSKKFYGSNDCKIIEKITFNDTIFRSGYSLDYIDSSGHIFLTSITPFTAKEKKKPYRFLYNISTQPLTFLHDEDSIRVNADYWGFDLGKKSALSANFINNSKYWIDVWEDRYPDLQATKKNVLTSIIMPEGSIVNYDYELNNRKAYSLDYKYYNVGANTATTNYIDLQDIFVNNHQISFQIDTNLLRFQTPPFNGTKNFICKIKTTNIPSTVVDSVSISLYDLYYNGIKKWTVNAPNGTYIMSTYLESPGGGAMSNFDIYISWYNHLTSNPYTNYTGGLRVHQVTIKNDVADIVPISVKTYKYINEDLSSSGIIGEPPLSAYNYNELYINNIDYTIINRVPYKAIGQQPLNNFNLSQNGPAGYQRVEVISGTPEKNSGKVVYEFSSLDDASDKNIVPTFPYAPSNINSWALGLPTVIKTYDSTGRLLKKTNMKYDIKTQSFISPDDRSLKMGILQTILLEDAQYHVVSKKKIYLADDYYPQSGSVLQRFVYDTTYQNDGSILTSKTEYQYDTLLFILKKVIADYDKIKGLSLEKRLYYPQDYTIGGTIAKLRNNNIITPVIATEQWITGDANPRLVSGNITDFQQITNKSIRPYHIFQLETNKPLSLSTIGAFDPSKLNRNNTYFKQQAEYPLYDNIGNLLQATNSVTGISSAVIMDYSNFYKTAEVSNALFADIAYSSFESDGDGNWIINSSNRNTVYYFSGKRSYALSNGNITKNGLDAAKTYLVSFWGKTGTNVSVLINGVSTGGAVSSQNGWNFYTKTFTNATQVTISGTGTIDELRLHPVDANMITYTYEPNVGMTSMVDANNTIIYYEYDNLNRLKVVRDRNKNILQKYQFSDSIYTNTLFPDWQFDSIHCNGTLNYDSVFQDMNPFSFSFRNYLNTAVQNPAPCTCMLSNYKCINGIPDPPVRINKSTTRIGHAPNYQWVCVWYYQWSDCSKSEEFTETNSSPCSTSTGCN